MSERNWVSFAPVGAGIVIVLMFLATALVNHRNAYDCALDATMCRGPSDFAASAPPAATQGAERFARLIQSSAEEGQNLLTAHISLYLLAACIVLVGASLAAVLMVTRQQQGIERAQRAADEDNAATTERIVKLIETVTTEIRALEESTRELEAGVKAFATGSAAHERGLAAVVAEMTRAREDQSASGKIAAETGEQLDRTLSSVIEELARNRQALADQLLPSITRRDERLVAIDANLTVVADRFSILGADISSLATDIQHNLRETAVLTEIVRALEKSLR